MQVPQSQLRFIVGNMHVGTSCTSVVRDLYRRFKTACVDEPLTTQAIPLFSRKFRKACYRYAVKVHRANRQLCIDFRM